MLHQKNQQFFLTFRLPVQRLVNLLGKHLPPRFQILSALQSAVEPGRLGHPAAGFRGILLFRLLLPLGLPRQGKGLLIGLAQALESLRIVLGIGHRQFFPISRPDLLLPKVFPYFQYTENLCLFHQSTHL